MTLLLVAAYFIPTITAIVRAVRNTGSVVVINLLLGWTLIGWAVALAMAMRTVDREPREGSRWVPRDNEGVGDFVIRAILDK
jgi:hypothetical protein